MAVLVFEVLLVKQADGYDSGLLALNSVFAITDNKIFT